LKTLKAFFKIWRLRARGTRRPQARDQDRKFEALLRTKGLNELSNQDLRYLLGLQRCQDIKSEDAKRLTKSEAQLKTKEIS
jgi:hypothetical protein